MKLQELLKKEIEKNRLEAGEGEYYLVSMSDADRLDVRCTSLRTVGAAGQGISRPAIVVTNDGLRGFRKDSRAIDDSDDTEIVLNLWGRYVGVPMAQEFRVFDRELNRDSLLSLDVAPPGWRFCEMRRIRESIEERVKAGELSMSDWMIQWRNICLTRAFPDVEGNVENVCESEADYRITIEIPIRMAECYFAGCPEDYEPFRRDYFRMVMFDLFIGQTDRTLHNYGILIRGESEAFRLAPLFDNATLAKPYLPDNIYALNGAAADRTKLLNMLLREYADYTVPIAEEILAVYREMGGRMEEVSGLWIGNHNLPLLQRNTKRFQTMLYEAGFPRRK